MADYLRVDRVDGLVSDRVCRLADAVAGSDDGFGTRGAFLGRITRSEVKGLLNADVLKLK